MYFRRVEIAAVKPTLDQYIVALLYDYDCVVVPQLGGFVANYRPARIDTGRGLAHPPGKDIRFNRNLTKNDGLLASACADANGWSFEEANSFVREAVESYLTKLEGGEKVKLKKIGLLYIDEHKNLRFTPDAAQNVLKEAWGFETFLLPEKIKRTVPVVPAPADRQHPKPEKEHEAKVVPMPPRHSVKPAEEKPAAKSGHTRGIYRVAAATLLPFIGLSLYMGIQTGFRSPSQFSAADLLPFAETMRTERMYRPVGAAEFAEADRKKNYERKFPERSGAFTFSFSENKADTTGVWINLRKVHDAEVRLTTDEAERIPAADLRYHIISGCFAEAANAEKHVKNLLKSGYTASVLDVHKGLHRVAAESFPDYHAAVDRLENLRREGDMPTAWILKKQMNR